MYFIFFPHFNFQMHSISTDPILFWIKVCDFDRNTFPCDIRFASSEKGKQGAQEEIDVWKRKWLLQTKEQHGFRQVTKGKAKYADLWTVQ